MPGRLPLHSWSPCSPLTEQPDPEGYFTAGALLVPNPRACPPTLTSSPLLHHSQHTGGRVPPSTLRRNTMLQLY